MRQYKEEKNNIEKSIKNLIKNIIENMNENDINKTISFIEKEIKNENKLIISKKEIRYRSEYYIDYRDEYILLEDKSVQIVVRYPGGDLSCKTMSDPKSDIFIKVYNKYEKRDIIIFLYKNDAINKKIDSNKILNLIDEILIN